MSGPLTAAFRLQLLAEDEAATTTIAAALARVARRGDLIGLTGELGAGKTAFARGFIRALTRPNEEVPSPTFTLAQSYCGDTGTVYHFDLYRIESPAELEELGFEEALADGIMLVEWPDRLGPQRPSAMLETALAPVEGRGPGTRRITMTGDTSWQARLERLNSELAVFRDA